MMITISRSIFFYSGLLLFAASPVSVLHAAEWKLTPSLYAAETYNDNVFLSERAERSDFITQVNPELGVSGKGKNGKIDLLYTMQNVIYAENSQHNETFHALNLLSNVVLVPEYLFIDANIARTQQTVNRDAAIPFDNLGISSNRTTLDMASVSPYFHAPIGENIATDLRYRTSWVDYESESAVDSSEQRFNAALYSRRVLNNIQWDINYFNQNIYPDNNLDSKLENIALNLNYFITARFRLIGSRGYETNEYNQIIGPPYIEKGAYWLAGIGWQITPQQQITVKRGERFYGKTRELDWNFKGKKWFWDLTYAENFTTTQVLLVENQEAVDVSEIIVQPGDPLPGTEIFLDKSTRFGLTRSYSKTDVKLSLYNRKREYRVTKDMEKSTGGVFEVSWGFIKRTYFDLSLRYQVVEIRDSTAEDSLKAIGLGLRREFRKQANIGLTYQHYIQDSTEPARSEYDQNQITLYLDVVF